MNTDSSDLAAAIRTIDEAEAAGKLSATAAANVRQWLSRTAYRGAQPRLVTMIGERKFDELEALFWEIIPFGTGGRRGRMAELGSATINEWTIAESAQGMATYLKRWKGKPGGRAVVAHDTRHRSSEFARITAATFAANGLSVFLFDGHRSTPELSFAVRHLHCDVGVMISASHNPPSDNGFKAYWSDGAQVLPPHDKGIIECVGQAEDIPPADFDSALKSGAIAKIGKEVDEAYIAQVSALALGTHKGVRALYTPLHGVGETSVFPVLQEAGFSQVEVLDSQRQPDGSFPNVPKQLPNPELNSALQPAVDRALAIGADVVLASDPDADRLGVAVRDKHDRFHFLTGNQIGALLLDYVLRQRRAARSLSAEHFVVTTLVTTPMIRAIGESHGVRVIDDLLVGFKYIAAALDANGPEKFVFGCEESLGYLAGTYCRDKDAAVAALYTLELAADLKQRGMDLVEGLDELYERFGYFMEGQRSESCAGPRGKEQIDSLMQTLRTNPPGRLGGIAFRQLRDYEDRVARPIAAEEDPGSRTMGGQSPLSLSIANQGDLVFLDSEPGEIEFSIAARPSGTEPKIKFYFFAKAPRRGAAAIPVARIKSQTAKMLRELQDALSSWVRARLSADASAS